MQCPAPRLAHFVAHQLPQSGSISSTMGKSVRLDMSLIDPASNRFMREDEVASDAQQKL